MLALVGAACAWAGPVERMDPALDRLISTTSPLVPLKRQPDGFFEGPSWVGGRRGFLVISSIPDNQLLKVDRRGIVGILVRDVVRHPSEDAIHDSLYTNRTLVGSNGTAAVGSHSLLVARFGGTGIERIDLSTGKRTVIASGTGKTPFQEPNDIVIGPRGDAYFSAKEGLFRLRGKKVTLLRSMHANGLAFTPDGKALYATDGVTKIIKIAINPDGSAGAVEPFVDTQADPTNDEFVDGMKVDSSGNLWAVGPGGVWIIDPDGHLLGRILAPVVQMPTGAHHRFTNLEFGGSDGMTLFLTAPGGIYSIQLAQPLRHRGR
jgi:gluconolactonase